MVTVSGQYSAQCVSIYEASVAVRLASIQLAKASYMAKTTHWEGDNPREQPPGDVVNLRLSVQHLLTHMLYWGREGTFVQISFGNIINSAMNIPAHLQVELLNHKRSMCSALVDTVTQLSKTLYQFTFPCQLLLLTAVQDFSSPAFSQHLLIFIFFHLAILVGIR
jgi:hypothetical protein